MHDGHFDWYWNGCCRPSFAVSVHTQVYNYAYVYMFFRTVRFSFCTAGTFANTMRANPRRQRHRGGRGSFDGEVGRPAGLPTHLMCFRLASSERDGMRLTQTYTYIPHRKHNDKVACPRLYRCCCCPMPQWTHAKLSSSPNLKLRSVCVYVCTFRATSGWMRDATGFVRMVFLHVVRLRLRKIDRERVCLYADMMRSALRAQRPTSLRRRICVRAVNARRDFGMFKYIRYECGRIF